LLSSRYKLHQNMFSRSTADTVKVRHDPCLQFPMEVHIIIML